MMVDLTPLANDACHRQIEVRLVSLKTSVEISRFAVVVNLLPQWSPVAIAQTVFKILHDRVQARLILNRIPKCDRSSKEWLISLLRRLTEGGDDSARTSRPCRIAGSSSPTGR